MHRRKLTLSLAAVVAAGILGGALPGSAQKNKPGANTGLGFVDLGQVTDKIKETKEWEVSVKQFETEKSRLKNEIEGLTKVRYLSSPERQELTTLRAKQKPSDSEKARIDALEAQSGKLEQDYQRLATVEKPTDQQKAEIQKLAKLREDSISGLQEETNKRAGQLQKMEEELLEKMQKKILTAVEGVAQNQGLSMIVDRQAVLYGGQDITQDVLKKLGVAPPK